MQIHCDDVIEPDETLMLVPEDEAAYDLIDGGFTVGTGTILKDEPIPVLSIGDAVMAENCVEPMMFPVRSDIVAPEGGITFQFYTMPGTALAADFNQVFVWPPVFGTIPEGATETSVPVEIFCDGLPEDDEVFSAVLLPNPAFYSLGNATGQGTIIDYDSIVFTISDLSEIEGNGSGLSHMQFELMLSEPAPIDIPLHVEVTGDTASSPSDFTAFGADVEIREGDFRIAVPVTFRSDTVIEGDETFNVTVSGASFNAAASDLEAIGTIVNDDVGQFLRIDDTETVEGDDGTTIASFTVSLDHPIPASYGAVTVNYSTAAATAIADADYASVSGQLVFSGGTTNRAIQVPIQGDLDVEENESFEVVLSAPSGTNLSIADDTGVGTIVDDDTTGVFVSDVSIVEGDTGPAVAQFEISLDRMPPAGDDIQIAFETGDGTAGAGSDYAAAGGVLVFNAATALTQQVQVTINGDTAVEVDETFELHLSLQSGLDTVIVDGIGEATIVNDDSPATPQFVIHNENMDHRVYEGGSASTAFSVTLLHPDPPPAGIFDVDVGLLAGSATLGADFSFTPQTVQLSAAEPTAMILIPVLDDADAEGDEQFGLVLSNPSGGATLGTDASASVTIVDDESPGNPVILVSANDDSLYEHAGTAGFTVRLLPAGAIGDFEVTFNTEVGGAGTATPGSDFVPRVGQILVLNAAAPEVSVPVSLIDDAAVEAGEILSAQISNPSGGAVLGNAEASTVLLDNDTYHQQLSTSDVEVVEGDPGDVVVATFTVSLSTPIPAGYGPAGVDFEIVPVSATPGLDFADVAGTLVFEEGGPQQQQVQVTILSDNEHEDDELFGLVLTNAEGVNLTLPSVSPTGTIHDDDALPAVSVDDLVLPENDAPGMLAQVRVRLSTPIATGSGSISVKYETQDDTAISAEGDYTPVSGELEFTEGGPLEAFIAVPINGDTIPEPDEALLVRLFNIEAGVEGAVLLDDTARVTIQDDDEPAAPAFVIQNLDPGHVVYEGVAPVAVFQVRLLSPSPPVPGNFEVDVTSLAGSATQDADYAALQQTVMLSSADPTALVFVDILDDALDETDEGFSLTLSNPTNGAVLGFATTASVNIADDDSLIAPLVTLSADLPAVSEGAGHADFTLRLLPDDAAGPVEVTFETEAGVGGTAPALPGVDYEPVAGESFLLGAGFNTATVSVPIIDDAEAEDDEAISARISVAGGATLGIAAAATVILDNDGPTGGRIFSDGFED